LALIAACSLTKPTARRLAFVLRRSTEAVILHKAQRAEILVSILSRRPFTAPDHKKRACDGAEFCLQVLFWSDDVATLLWTLLVR
jgi:hypothetical protein